MRSRSFALASLAVVAWFGVVLADDRPAPGRARIDAPVRDFRLRDVMQDEETFVRLEDLKGKTVVLFFVSDKCQVTWLYERRTGKLIGDYKDKGVVFLGIRSSAGDSARELRSYCEAKNFDIPVLFDEENVVADHFGVQTTPQYAVIDAEGVLRYFGALDDNQTLRRLRQPEETATKHYVREALEAVLAGEEVTTKEAEGYG
jgi:peroxiredoxin